jgi:hypothetical protein
MAEEEAIKTDNDSWLRRPNDDWTPARARRLRNPTVSSDGNAEKAFSES